MFEQAANGDMQLLDVLSQSRIPLDVRDRARSLLDVAIQHNQEELALGLLRQGVPLTAATLWSSVAMPSLRLWEALVSMPCARLLICTLSPSGEPKKETALHRLVCIHDWDLARQKLSVFLSCEDLTPLETEVKDTDGFTAAEVAVHVGRQDLSDQLRSFKQLATWCNLASRGNIKGIMEWLAIERSIEPKHLAAVLHAAVVGYNSGKSLIGTERIVRVLLSRGADPCLVVGMGSPPAMFLATHLPYDLWQALWARARDSDYILDVMNAVFVQDATYFGEAVTVLHEMVRYSATPEKAIAAVLTVPGLDLSVKATENDAVPFTRTAIEAAAIFHSSHTVAMMVTYVTQESRYSCLRRSWLRAVAVMGRQTMPREHQPFDSSGLSVGKKKRTGS
jgi:hypothetical protein